MAYTTLQILEARKERAELQAIIEKRQQQEKQWRANQEEVFVPTNNSFTHISGLNLLDYAVKLGEFETVKALVQEGITSKSALLYALEGGYVDIAEYLITKGFKYDMFPAMRKSDKSCKDIVIKTAKTDFEKDYQKIAASGDIFYAPKHLAPKAPDAKATLLHYGALIPFDEFRTLVSQIPEDKIDWHQGIDATDKEEILFEKKKGFTPVGYAIFAQNTPFLSYLFQMGAKVSEPAEHDYGYTPMQLALRLGNMDAVNFLLEKGASLEDVDIMGASVLHLAIQSGNPKAVEFVLNHAKNLRLVANYGRNPVHYLAQCQNEAIITMILNHPMTKSFRDQPDYFGQTPMDLAKSHNNKILMQAVAKQLPEESMKKIEIQQGIVLDKLSYFLKLTNIGDPKSMPEGGHCNGFAFLFLYYRKRGLRSEFFKMLQLIASWDGNPDFLQQKEPVAQFSGDYRNVSDLFNQWAYDLIWFQQSHLGREVKELNPTQSSRDEQYALVKKDEKPFIVSQHFLMSGEEINEPQLEEYLAIFKKMPGSAIEFSAGGHATSLFITPEGELDYYDPNQPDELDLFTDSSKLAAHLKDTKYRMLKKLNLDGSINLEIRFSPERNYQAFPSRNKPWDSVEYQSYYDKSPNKLTPLHVAIIANDEKEVEAILQNKAIPLDLKDGLGRTALDLAVIFNMEKMVKLFCQYRADFILENPSFLPRLSKKNKALRDDILETFPFQHSGGLLNQAVIDKDQTLVDKLLQMGISPDEEGGRESFLYSKNPLFNAVDLEQLEVVKSLMTKGATLPNTVEFLRILVNRPEIAQYLIVHFPEKIAKLTTEEGTSFVHYILLGYGIADEVRKKLLDVLVANNLLNLEKVSHQHLIEAINSFNKVAFDCLVDLGVSLDQVDEKGRSPLIIALDSSWSTNIDFAKALIDKGADVTIQDREKGAIAIHYAVFYTNDKALVQMLIDSDSPLEHKTLRGMTPLHIAVSKDKIELVKVLLKAGASLEEKGPEGKTALALAEEINPQMAHLMREHQKRSTSKVGRLVTQFESMHPAASKKIDTKPQQSKYIKRNPKP